MLCYDVNSLEELEEIKRLEARAAAEHLEAKVAIEQANNNLPDHIPYDSPRNMNFLFDLQMSAYLGVLLAS